MKMELLTLATIVVLSPLSIPQGESYADEPAANPPQPISNAKWLADLEPLIGEFTVTDTFCITGEPLTHLGAESRASVKQWKHAPSPRRFIAI